MTAKQAIVELLSRPDPRDLRTRGHRKCCEGVPSKQRLLRQTLPQAYIQYVRLDREQGSAP